MKRIVFYLLILAVVASVLVFGAARWWKVNTQPVSNDTTLQRFVIPKGRSAAEIGTKLAKEEFIKNPLAFKIYVQATDRAKKIQAGEYDISPNLTLTEIVDKLTRGPDELWVTIPEGLRREEIVEKFVESLDMNLLAAAVFRQEFLKESAESEGFLFPDTYLFPRNVSASVVVNKMTKTFDSIMTQFQRVLLDENIAGGFDNKGIVTLASIIERETRSNEERPIVAGILFKRLEIGMRLQVDATVQYAVASDRCSVDGEQCNWWSILTKEDLEINSPYNTYKFFGLPPGPIANPGFYSIEAVVRPENSPYWYYIHDPEGSIHYAETLSEHNANVRRYLGK
jgi:UPF0755 protein